MIITLILALILVLRTRKVVTTTTQVVVYDMRFLILSAKLKCLEEIEVDVDELYAHLYTTNREYNDITAWKNYQHASHDSKSWKSHRKNQYHCK